mmetsp:Transcript_21475/g.64534  ORF Transcript_21475/g.64534 Transcript_21475/m.64534 type:complete len:358 (+) Transcript_21475:293-1366(+)
MASKQQSAACVVFSNSRSGGGKGGAVLKAFAATLGADRVFDLGANPHPEEILAGDDLVREATSDAGLRVIVCGGDGTMTWIMSAVDVARERRHLAPEDAKYYVAMMPLGTGNDLARTFGWGGKFRRACLLPAWLDAVRGAEPVQLDRWLVSVMPSAEGQKAKDELPDVPEVFSVHEFSAHVEEHRVVKEGRHHSTTLTTHAVERLTEHHEDRERARSESRSADRSTMESVTFDADVIEDRSFSDEGTDTRMAELVAEHVRPSETVLSLGGTWRSYDGTFSNYFSLGVDAAGGGPGPPPPRPRPTRNSWRTYRRTTARSRPTRARSRTAGRAPPPARPCACRCPRRRTTGPRSRPRRT